MILSLDQSSNATGFALFNKGKLITYGVIDLNKMPKGGEEEYTNKRIVLKNRLSEIITDNLVKLTLTEGVYGQNIKTCKILSKVQGSVQDLCKELDIDCFSFANAGEWRKLIGVKGKKREEYKENTKQYVLTKYDIPDNLSDDEYDAIAIYDAYCVLAEREV